MMQPFSLTLPMLLQEQTVLRGDKIAVISDGVETSYSGLARRADQVTAALLAIGVQAGDRIGLLASNRVEWLEIFFGASKAGAVVVPISTWSTQAELAFILNDANVTILFSAATVGKIDFSTALSIIQLRTATLKKIILITDEQVRNDWLRYEDIFARDYVDWEPNNAPDAADDALILYTSGSSNKPKAVRLAHYGLIENGFNIGERQGLCSDDRVMTSVPLFWAYGSANALPATFTHGAALVLQERFDAEQALSLIERHRCTAIYTLPSMTSALISHPSFKPDQTRSLRTGLTIGSPQDVLNAANILGARHICNIYGSSETYGNCCVTPHYWPIERRAACQGPPLPGFTLRLINGETGEEVADGEPGQIEVAGYIMRGYGGESATHNAEAFANDGWYRTGDIGQLTDAGDIAFLGRHSEMIKRSGINVSPAEVEDVLMQHPAVKATAVVGAQDDQRGEIIVGFVVCKPDMATTAADLIAHCRSLCSSYKVPDRIEFRSTLPSTATGKLQRQPLKAEAQSLHQQEKRNVA